MRACARLVLVSLAMSAGLSLAACDSIDRFSDTMQGMFDTKRRLPGERKPVFPEGVPGVTQGVPPEYLPASKQPEEATDPAAQESHAPAETKAAETPSEKKEKPAHKPRPRTADIPKKQVESEKPATAEPAKPAQSQAAWPQPAQSQTSPTAPWPAAPPPGTFSR